MIRAAVLAALVAGPAAADDWHRLTGAEVTEALSARVLAYDDGATQNFFADGQTLYEDGGASWGHWRVEGDRYCSQWPQSDRWDCYDVDRHARGLDLRFVARDGSATVGRYVDLQ